MMSKTIKIVTTKRNRLGSILILPEVGETQIPTDGVIEVPESVAAHLVEKGIGWEYEGDAPAAEEAVEEVAEVEVAEEVSSEANGGATEEIVAEATGDESGSTDADVSEADESPAKESDSSSDLSKLSLTKLKNLCSNAELPKDEWKKLNKTDIIKYIGTKLD